MNKNTKTLRASASPRLDQGPAEVTALAVRVEDLPMPEGSPAEQANALHREFLKSAKTTAVRAVQCGWVLSNVRASCGHGAWQHWVAENLEFAERTAYNYIAAYEKTVGAARAGMRRPVPLSVEPTMEEIESACSHVAEQPMTDLYRATGLVERRAGWGGAGRGQGRKPRLKRLSLTRSLTTRRCSTPPRRVRLTSCGSSTASATCSPAWATRSSRRSWASSSLSTNTPPASSRTGPRPAWGVLGDVVLDVPVFCRLRGSCQARRRMRLRRSRRLRRRSDRRLRRRAFTRPPTTNYQPTN